jgi:hypothetical protein
VKDFSHDEIKKALKKKKLSTHNILKANRCKICKSAIMKNEKVLRCVCGNSFVHWPVSGKVAGCVFFDNVVIAALGDVCSKCFKGTGQSSSSSDPGRIGIFMNCGHFICLDCFSACKASYAV